MVKVLPRIQNFSIISQMFTPEYSQKYFNNLQFSIYLKNMCEDAG